MARNANENEYLTTKITAGINFEKYQSWVFIWNGKKSKREFCTLLFVEHYNDQYPENKYIDVYKGFTCEIMHKSWCKT
jgi:hypothetical protein